MLHRLMFSNFFFLNLVRGYLVDLLRLGSARRKASASGQHKHRKEHTYIYVPRGFEPMIPVSVVEDSTRL